MTRSRAQRRKAGYTLTEVSITMIVMVVALGGVLWTFLSLSRTYRVQKQYNTMQQNLFSCVDSIVRDVRMAGYGLDIDAGSLPRWIDWVPGVSAVIDVDQGTSGKPDRLSIVAGTGGIAATLTQAASAGATLINVSSNAAAALDTKTRKIIYVGRTETARIVSMSSQTLTISTDPSVSGQGLRYAYPVGAPIEVVEVLTYSCEPNPKGFPHRPYLVRNDNTGQVTNDLRIMIGLDIDDFQVTPVGVGVSLELRARIEDPDRTYTHPDIGDHFRRKVLTTRVIPRNAR